MDVPGDTTGDGGMCAPPGIEVVAMSGDALGDLGDMLTFGTAPVVGRDRTVVFRSFVGEAFIEALARRPQGMRATPITFVGDSLSTGAGSQDVSALQGNPVVATDGSVGYQVVLTGGDNAAFAFDPGSTTSAFLIAEGAGSAGPLGEPFVLLEPFTNRNRRTAYDGTLVFHSYFVSADPSPRITEPRGVWQATASTPPSVVILDDGQPVDIPPDTATYGPAEPQVSVTSSGVIAIATGIRRAPSAGFDIDRGIFRFGRSGDEQVVTAPSFTGAYVQTTLNASGDLAYVETGPGGTGVVVESGPVAEAARDQAVPDLPGATFVAPSAGLAYLNDGRIVFASSVEGGERDGGMGVFAQTSGGIRTLAIEGQEVPGAPGVTIADIQTVHVNDDGGVAIRAVLAGDGVRSGFDTAILMTTPVGDLRLMLRADTELMVGCRNLIIQRVSVLSDLIPGTEVELFGPGHGGLPHAITDDGAVAVHIAFVPEGAEEVEVIVLVDQPPSTGT